MPQSRKGIDSFDPKQKAVCVNNDYNLYLFSYCQKFFCSFAIKLLLMTCQDINTAVESFFFFLNIKRNEKKYYFGFNGRITKQITLIWWGEKKNSRLKIICVPDLVFSLYHRYIHIKLSLAFYSS